MSNKIDLVLVDLPYGQTACKWDTIIDLKKMWIELKNICTEKCVYVFFCTTKFGFQLIQSNEKWFRYDLVWKKSKKIGFFNANKQPMRQHEMIYIFSKTSGVYNPQKHKGKPFIKEMKDDSDCVYGKKVSYTIINTGDRHPGSVLKFNNPFRTVHPTQKPIDLCEWLIKAYSNKDDMVLDFTMGSGSTGVACLRTNRNFIGIEKDTSIFRTARNRLIQTELTNDYV